MQYVLKKTGVLVVTLLLISLLAFLAFQIIPADPVTKLLGTDYTPERAEALRHEMGLDRNVFVRYFDWLTGFVTGDMGDSYSYGMGVEKVLEGKGAVTAGLSLMAWLMVIAISVPLGITLARFQGGRLDRVFVAMNQVFMAIPPFFLGILFTYVFGLVLKLFVPGGFISPRESFWGFLGYLFFPALAYAIPGFITLLGFKFMFSYGGPINHYITEAGRQAIGFLDLDAKWSARIIGLLVNAWISIPSSMLLATGILSNADQSQYEAARLDGAGAFQQFRYLTLPFVVFSTTPVLISQFIGNFNNFGIFYFLRGGLYIDGYFLASDTDLLINWLYNLSIDNNYYAIGAAISLIIFIITSLISLAVYVASPAYRQEETYR